MIILLIAMVQNYGLSFGNIHMRACPITERSKAVRNDSSLTMSEVRQ